jgi:hypothetical protein
LRSAREAAFRHFDSANNLDERKLSLEVLEWNGEVDKELDGAALRGRFAGIGADLTKLPDYQQIPLHQSLAAALAASGLQAEASALMAELPAGYRQDDVRDALATAYARRGNLREAFVALDAIEDREHKDRATMGVIRGIANTGKPDLARDAAKFLAPLPGGSELIAAMFAFTGQESGDHAAARSNALAIKAYRDRNSVLFQLLHRYRKLANYTEAVATAIEIRKDAMKAGDTESSGAALEFLVADLLSMDAHAQILALLQGESGDDRTRVIDRVLEEETDAGVVREAGKLVDAMPRDERAKREIPLLLARVRSFDLGPRDAVAQASHPEVMAEGLVRVARNLDANRRPAAREILQAAVTANRDRPGPFWEHLAVAQADVGLRAEAHATVDRRIADPDKRALALIRVSGAETAQGRVAEAARSLDAGARMLNPAGTYHYEAAAILQESGYPEVAASELLAGIRAGSPGLEYVSSFSTSAKVIVALVKRGDTRRAMELAAAVSTHLHDDPEPFVDLYCELVHVTGPILD